MGNHHRRGSFHPVRDEVMHHPPDSLGQGIVEANV